MNLRHYESRLNRPLLLKLPEFQRNERLKHVLFARQFDLDLLGHLGSTATMIRRISKRKDGYLFLSDLLSHRRAMLYFTQPSTRTFLSFMAACQILGMTCNEIRDPALSSEYKGEDPLDSIRMFSSFFDVIIMRSGIADFAECCAYLMNDLEEFNQRSVPIVNAGSGADEHPTQALLDIYTIQRSFAFESATDSSEWTRFYDLQKKYPTLIKGLDHKSYCFCGDVGRGRTVRSLATLLSLYKAPTMYFVAPQHPKVRLSAGLRDDMIDAGVTVRESDSLQEILPLIDLLYMTRTQHEHDTPEDNAFFATINPVQYRLSPELLPSMKDYAPILHPFPRNEEIPLSIDTDHRAMYFRQARNGMWIRAALLAHLFDVDGKITTYHQRIYKHYHDYNTTAL